MSVRFTISPCAGPSIALCGSSTKLFRSSGMPVIAPRLLLVAVHALLHHRPLAVVGHEEAVEVEIEAVLHGGAVDLGDQAACACQRGAVKTDAFAEGLQFIRCLSRVLASTAANVDAEFVRQRPQPALEGADDAGGDAGRMPVHPHDRTERLEPERMRQPLQELIATIMVDDGLRDDGAERGHARREPRRHASTVQRKNCAAGSSCHSNRKVQVRPAGYQADVPGSGALLMVRNVIEYRGDSTAGMLCSQIRREAPDIM